ncbi:UNVERIFIED_CONTAM: Heterogeneous nuclear ribonucleoprotein 1 [Sesamum latifolium]|uniref:Heterogeneous nuclear ribonucleoprotein 1 n=1 Tax=Sesamum latifolium TaxID=2727402 RepID=A0AAW2WTR3_9LAMI
MRDRRTGRARGFGFVVFADPAVAERVVKEKHMIDGRTVEAKKAVPRDDQHLINRNSGSIQGSPGPGRTKKIFVGGLASTVTEKQNFALDSNYAQLRGYSLCEYEVDGVRHGSGATYGMERKFRVEDSRCAEVRRDINSVPSCFCTENCKFFELASIMNDLIFPVVGVDIWLSSSLKVLERELVQVRGSIVIPRQIS